jgi:phage tail tape-measure protein
MARKIMAVALMFILGAPSAGCATNGYYSPERSAAVGALGGAATGAAVGSIIGAGTGAPAFGAGVGAATGGVIGAVGGFLYAGYRNSKAPSAAYQHQKHLEVAPRSREVSTSKKPSASVRSKQGANKKLTEKVPIREISAPVPAVM